MALKQVFSNIRYLILAGIVGFVIFVFSTWLPNLGLIVKVVSSSTASFTDKVMFLASLLGSIQTNFTALSAFYTITIAALFGVNMAMVAYYLKQRKQIIKPGSVVTGFGGLVSGAFGLGCAACGSFLFTAGFSLFGASSALALLPFAGGGFGILGILLLMASIYLVARQIQNPAVCKINS